MPLMVCSFGLPLIVLAILTKILPPWDSKKKLAPGQAER
jgi:hypothetical protein